MHQFHKFILCFRQDHWSYKPVWHIPLLSVQWMNSWWWTDELSETCRVSWQDKLVKLVHLVCFITKQFVTMHGHMNVKFVQTLFTYLLNKWSLFFSLNYFSSMPTSVMLPGCSALHKYCKGRIYNVLLH